MVKYIQPQSLYNITLNLVVQSKSKQLFPKGFAIPKEYTLYFENKSKYIKKAPPAPMIREIVPKNIYIDYLEKYVQDNEKNWNLIFDDMVYDFWTCHWNFSKLKIEQVILLQNHPNRWVHFFPKSSLVFVKYFSMKNFSSGGICMHCLKTLKLKKILYINEFYRVKNENLPGFFQTKTNWCQRCKYQALFTFDFKICNETTRSNTSDIGKIISLASSQNVHRLNYNETKNITRGRKRTNSEPTIQSELKKIKYF